LLIEKRAGGRGRRERKRERVGALILTYMKGDGGMERGKTGEGGILRGGCGEREKRREDAKRMEVWRNPEFDLRLFLKATWGKALVFLSAKPLPSSVRLLREKQILDQYITWSSVLFLDVTSLTSLQKNEGGAH